MSSEQLADGVNPLDAELAATWDILKGYSGRDTDLGIARRFGGAAAAYSLRDIGAMNGRVVKARRDVDGQGSDPEEDFSANQVQDGTLERWVNGELESTLPADVDTAAAAYSLRKVKASYSGDAVRIRRSSDDAEVNVAFDSDSKVSSSSSISTVSGSTTATDLNGFLNETLTVGVALAGGASASDRPDSFTNATNSSFTATVTDTAGGYFPYETAIGDVITVSFDLELSGGASPSACTSTSINTINNASNTVLYTTSGSYTNSFTCTADGTHFRFADGDDGTFSVTNFRIVSHTHSATVHTWYDQAGVNNAVQETAANQPKIAENGALLADGLDFDGSNDFLESTTLSSIYTGTDKAHSSFVVVNSDAATTTQYILGIGSTSASNPLRNTLFHSGGNIGWQVRDDAGTLKTDLTANPYVANQTYLVSALNSGTTIDFNTNSVINDNGTDADVGASTINTVKIGALAVNSSNTLNGSIKEAIFYASDQSDNRFKIESNINNYYSLYNDANDLSAAFDSNGSISASSKDGFTADVATFSHYVNATFNNSVATGETIYVSFNAQLAPNGGTTASPILRLQNAQVGSNTSNQSSISEGFNSIDLTATGTSDRVGFLEQDDNVDYIISDFKVSRIPRNGFVERLYDQSGNGRDMAQTTAGDQPHIVENGGICKDSTNNPTVKYVNVGTNLGSTFLSTTAGVISSGETSLCYLTVASISTNVPTRQTFNGAGTDFCLGGTNPRLRYNGSANTFTTSSLAMSVNTNHLVVASVNSSKICTLHLDDNSETDTSAFTANASNLNQFLGENSSSSTSDNLGLQGTMSEMILYLGDKTNDISDLQNDINNFYNI